MIERSHVLSYAPAEPRFFPWLPFLTLSIGAFGGPLAYVAPMLFESFIPVIVLSSGALVYSFAARKKYLVFGNPPRRSLMGIVGLILILLWAPLLLMLSIVAWLVPQRA